MKRISARSSVVFGIAIALAACSSTPKPNANSVPIMGDENVVAVTADNQILWNGEAISSAHFISLLAETAAITPEPRLTFAPGVGAGYEMSAIVLGIIRASDVTNYGFVGNGKLAEP